MGIILISSITWYIQPKEFKENISKSPSSIDNKTIAEPEKVVNATRVKEVEEFLNNTPKIKSTTDKTYIQRELEKEKFTPVTVRMYDSNKIDIILSILSKDEFKLKEISPSLPVFKGNITISGIKKLEENPYVEQIRYGGFTTAAELVESVPLINVNDTWNLVINGRNITGEFGNTTICVIDTGVNYSHSDLGGCLGSGCKVVSGYNTINENTNINDTNGHGTHVSGIAVANGSVKGVAKGANMVMLKAIGGDSVDVEEAINWCISNRTKYNISTIVMSLSVRDASGNPIFYSTKCTNEDDAVKAANNATNFGLSVIVASGNHGNISSLTSPACGENVTSVGAVYKEDLPGTSIWSVCSDFEPDTDQITCFTNRGNLLDIVAPGVYINSTELAVNGSYANISGTSMAAPHVAGVAALMKQANNSLTSAEIENLLKKTGRPVYDSAISLTFPRVDALKAVLSSYNDLAVTNFQVLNTDGFNVTFEFRIFNSENKTLTDVGWKLETGEDIINSTTNITLKPYEEAFVYARYTYSTAGDRISTAYATSDSANSNKQNTSVSITGRNLRLTNFTRLYSSGTERTFEFFIENNGTTTISNIYWNMTVPGEAGVNGTEPISLKVNERAFVYIRYNYTTGGLHNVTATVDPTNSITETIDNDNNMTITND